MLNESYNKNTRTQILRFLVAGCSAVLTDMIVYYVLKMHIEPSIAKTISFLSGTILSYIVNKFWTFEKTSKSRIEALKFISLYLMTLCINVIINYLVLNLSSSSLLGFFAATGTSTVLNFIGMKWWVFAK